MKLTVFFDGSFWYGLIEYSDFQNNYRAIKYLFGKEPKDVEIIDFIDNHLLSLIAKNDKLKLSNNCVKKQQSIKKLNPKRMRREINRAKKRPVLSTKSQLAISESRSSNQLIKHHNSKLEKAASKQRKFEIKQEKKYQKHKGH
ncbi:MULTISPECIES: YjdF family protein [unclassified Enterococcus]|uniref:YjdF family protein n=1 Tax=unclassified Enterococcus TaxID=2608891 RepID=UPI001557A786|nr:MULTISPECIES: YjdF family protein [unclassified Enterococcus]MBS7576111.1 YjdF family protein [Enterococcus sp. MMGLQ5-2]MBS7583344.1 YjdF family protein [Enterococcus sp. MMGLQ5-1]NPD11204.1 YjdF family protein [Enterococcus sp. MMGLQ5-1]NPD35947.1 YjdF family protein [Enterococcus sp. MMGLQ5-2]